MNQLRVFKGRTNVYRLELGIDISTDVITSQIRTEPAQDAPLIADFEVTVVGDGTTGKLDLRLDDVVTSQISATTGWMDIKRMSGGEPIPTFEPIEVIFVGTVTA